MSTRFTDAFYYIALLSPRDADHDRAVAMANEFRGHEFVTTDAVLIEVLAYFAEHGSALRLQAAALVRDLRSDPKVRVIPLTRHLFDRGLALYTNRPDKGYSLTDSISMETCRAMRIRDVLTKDHHFEQEGFTVLF